MKIYYLSHQRTNKKLMVPLKKIPLSKPGPWTPLLAPSHLNRGSRFSIAALSVYAIAETLVNGTAYKRNSAQKSDGLWIFCCSRTLSSALVREKAKLLPAAMAEVEIDGLELEAMRRDDHSWHPCQVSLRWVLFLSIRDVDVFLLWKYMDSVSSTCEVQLGLFNICRCMCI